MSVYQSEGGAPVAGGSRFEPFELTVNLGPDYVPWLSAASGVGFVHGIPRRSATLPPLTELLDGIVDYTAAIRYAERQPAPELSRILGELVFGDPLVLQLFQATRGVAADRGRQVLFRILAAPHFAGLPWELLPDPATAQGGGQHYLALTPNTHLVRLARGRTYAARTALLEAPLNLLLVLSSPRPRSVEEDEQSFDIFQVKHALLAELATLEQDGMLHVDVVDRPTPENLRRQIGKQRRGYHLFHYVGHAKPDHLILEDRAGEARDLDSSQFMEVLRLCPDLRLAVFAGCETARAAGDPTTLDARKAAGRDLLSLADCCVQEACPVVIGMQAVLPFSTERLFTRFFYQALAHGYSIAEALHLARGAIQGDEHRSGDLLDWSVPTLFIGNSDPGPLLPRSAAAPKKPGPSRSDLKLGLRLSSERFYGRELPLRQAVDILAGETTERVLVVTGASGVGKTELLDRALEELATTVTHVLYVSFDRLAPEVAQAGVQLAKGSMPDLAVLAGLKPDSALERLCLLVTELLREGVTHPRDAAWTIEDWWERLIEDMVQHKSVLAVEDIVLDRVQRGLLDRLVDQWVAARTDVDLKAMSKERLLNDRLELLSQLQESLEQGGDSPQPASKLLVSILADLDKYLQGLPDRLLAGRAQVLSDALERLVARLSYQAIGGEPGGQAPSPAALKPADVKGALNQLEQVRETLSRALRILADRRSPVRIVVTAAEIPQKFLDLPVEQVFEMRLAPLGWPETWRWIHGNLPGLLDYRDMLPQLWSPFGVRLDRWEELERRVLLALDLRQDVNLQKLAEEIAPRPQAGPTSPAMLLARRGARPLRIAVAGPHLAGQLELADAITRLAGEHGIGGRIVLAANEAGALAALIEETSPFGSDGTTEWSKLLEWLLRVSARMPDIILLDYGVSESYAQFAKRRETRPDRTLLRSLHYGSLLIAAGGNKRSGLSEVNTPSAYPEVLGVGPLDDGGQLREYAEWTPDLRKPDLFIADDLATSPLAAALKPGLALFHKQQGSWGSSFAALHAVATATLVWSILPELSPRGVRKLLIDASKEIAEAKPALGLKIEDAVALARKRVVERRLQEGPAPLQTLSAMTGLDAQVLTDTLRKMDNVIRLTSGRLERYQLR